MAGYDFFHSCLLCVQGLPVRVPRRRLIQPDAAWRVSEKQVWDAAPISHRPMSIASPNLIVRCVLPWRAAHAVHHQNEDETFGMQSKGSIVLFSHSRCTVSAAAAVSSPLRATLLRHRHKYESHSRRQQSDLSHPAGSTAA